MLKPSGNERPGFPRPKRDEILYQKTLSQGFQEFPKRKENYEKYLKANRGEFSHHLPIIMDIENVSRCNFRCTMCEVSTWDKGKRAEDMNLEDFKKILNEQYGLIEIKLQGLGEPTMGASYFEMIKFARERHLWVRSTTNASLLHYNNIAEKFVSSDICELQISVDGASKQTYEKIRKGGKFELMQKNIKHLHSVWKNVGEPRTRMWTVLQKANFDEVYQFTEFSRELGFKRLTLALDLNDFGQESWKTKNSENDIHLKFSQEMAADILNRARLQGLDLSFWYLEEKFNTQSPKNLCPWPFDRLMISSDLRIVPCCMISNPNVASLGDGKQLLKEWNGETYRNFRKQHLTGKIPNFCKSCYKEN